MPCPSSSTRPGPLADAVVVIQAGAAALLMSDAEVGAGSVDHHRLSIHAENFDLQAG